jgi:hypothetical protein
MSKKGNWILLTSTYSDFDAIVGENQGSVSGGELWISLWADLGSIRQLWRSERLLLPLEMWDGRDKLQRME